MSFGFVGIGFLGSDPELKEITNGYVVKFNVGVRNGMRDQTNGNERVTAWHNVVYFARGDDDFVVKQIKAGNMKKGSTLQFNGNISVSKFEGKNGVAYSTEMIADGVNYSSVGTPESSDSNGAAAPSGPSDAAPVSTGASSEVSSSADFPVEF